MTKQRRFSFFRIRTLYLAIFGQATASTFGHYRRAKTLQEVIEMQDTLPMVMNVKDVAQALGVSETTARNLMKREDFPAFPVTPSMRRVYRERFIEWLNKQGS
jgi:predicted DNA-binding transcriptional regulator AlpA